MRMISLLCALIASSPLMAQSVTNTAGARAQVFATDREAVQLSSSLTKQEKGAIKALIPLLEKQMQIPVEYYSSIAYAPDQGLVSEALQGAFNHHSPAAADRAALRACAEAKPRGAGACRIAARVLPRGYKTRPLTLSASATRALLGNFSRQSSPKAYAISPATGAWGIGPSDRTAISRCRNAGATDCQVIIRD